MRLPCVSSARDVFSACMHVYMLPECSHLKTAKTVRKFLCSAQDHPIYFGVLTVLMDFFGAVVSLSISQRNCCSVKERTSSELCGHLKRPSDSLIYNRSHPFPSHTNPLMCSIRRTQKSYSVSGTYGLLPVCVSTSATSWFMPERRYV